MPKSIEYVLSKLDIREQKEKQREAIMALVGRHRYVCFSPYGLWQVAANYQNLGLLAQESIGG